MEKVFQLSRLDIAVIVAYFALTMGVGVAMGNALPIVKEAADIVTGTNEQDGIAMVLEEKMLSCV